MNSRRVLIGLIVAVVVFGWVTSRGGSDASSPMAPASAAECEEARIAFEAAVGAKERLDAEGRLTPELQRRHNDTIIEEGNFLEERCGGL